MLEIMECRAHRCLNRGVSGSDLKKECKSRSQILNEGLGISVSLGFYHSIPQKVNHGKSCKLSLISFAQYMNTLSQMTCIISIKVANLLFTKSFFCDSGCKLQVSIQKQDEKGRYHVLLLADSGRAQVALGNRCSRRLSYKSMWWQP